MTASTGSPRLIAAAQAMSTRCSVGADARSAVLPIGATGDVDVYVFTQSASGYGALAGPIHLARSSAS